MMIIASRDVTQCSNAYRQWFSEETATSEISVIFYQITQCHVPKDNNFHKQRRENQKSLRNKLIVITVVTEEFSGKYLYVCFFLWRCDPTQSWLPHS